MVIVYFVLSPKAVTVFDTFQIETFSRRDEYVYYSFI